MYDPKTGLGIKLLRVLVKATEQDYDYDVFLCHVNGPKAGTFIRTAVSSKKTKLRALTNQAFEAHVKGKWDIVDKKGVKPLVDEFNSNRAKRNPDWKPMFQDLVA